MHELVQGSDGSIAKVPGFPAVVTAYARFRQRHGLLGILLRLRELSLQS